MNFTQHCSRITAVFAMLLCMAANAVSLHAQDADPRALHRQGMADLEAGKFDDAYRSLARAHELDGKNANYKHWFMLISVYMGQNAIYANDHDTALRHFTAALALKKELSPEEDVHYVTIRRLVDLVKEHALYSTAQPEYVHAFQVLYIMNTDLKDTLDGQGKTVSSKDSLSETQIRETYRHQGMLKFYIETLTRGKVSLSFDRKIVNTTLTRATIYGVGKDSTVFRPDFNSTTESLGPLMFEGRNRYDSNLVYFNNANFNVIFYSNGVPPVFIPYTWYGQWRGSVIIPQFKNETVKNSTMISRFHHCWVLFHEFFHVIEGMSGGIKIGHAHLKENIEKAKNFFPDWVPDPNPVYTATEYTWFRYQLLNTVPSQMEKKSAENGLHPPFRNFGFILTRPDITGEYVYRTYTAAVKGISLDNLRRASELLDQAYKLRREKKNDESVEALKQALEHNPCHHQVLLELGREALGRKDYAGADRYFTTAAKVFPDPKELFSIAKSFFDKNEYTLAAKFFRTAADGPGRSPVYTLWLGRALAAANDFDAAKDVFARIGTDPIMKASIAYITNNGAGLALHSTANPEDESAPGLTGPKRQEGYRWKLVPSGEKDHVFIVSEYNWKCLTVRGGRGNYKIVLDGTELGEGGMWRLGKDAGGHYRIVSKKSGTPLAAIIAGEKKKPALTVDAVDTGAHTGWEIEVLDSALNSMDGEKTVKIHSAVNDMGIDLFASKIHDGAAINLWQRTGNSNQFWKFIPSGDPGFVYIVAYNSWKGLTAREKNGALGAMQWTITGDSAQKWRVVPDGAGRHRLINKKFNKALEVNPVKPSSHTLQLGDISDAECQLWKLEY